MTKLNALTPDQIALSEQYKDRYREYLLNTEPADRLRAEAAIKRMYKLFGAKEPFIRWVASPQEGVFTIALFHMEPGTDYAAMDKKFTPEYVRDYWPKQRKNKIFMDAADAANAVYWHWGQWSAPWISMFSFSQDVWKVFDPEDVEKLAIHDELVQSCCWVTVYDGICFVSDRPDIISVETTIRNGNEQLRLHNADGPAIRFRDGYSIYMWHGVPIPSDIIEHPESITVSRIMSERNAELSRCMIEKIGLDRFFNEAKPKVLDQDLDASGMPRRLLSISVPNDPERVVVSMQVKCPSTHHDFFIRVPPTITSCKQAMAWTMNMDVSRLNDIVAES